MPELVYSEQRHHAQLHEASDQELMEHLQRADEGALSVIIERKTKPLVQAVYRILNDLEESRDVVQMTFLRIWERRDSFDPRWSPNTWIFRIATNLAIDHLRSRRTRERSTEPVRHHLRQISDRRNHHERSQLHNTEVMEIFRELADELTERQRTIFVLREVEGLSSQEVAEISGCRESTVRNHLFNARKVLRRELLARYPEYAGERSPSTGEEVS